MSTNYGTIDHLKLKMQNWNPQLAADLHGASDKAFLKKAEYIWEEANTDLYEGFLYYGQEMAAYINAEGEEYILSSWIPENDFDNCWRANLGLYNISQTQDTSFKIVRPFGLPSGFGSRTYKKVTIDNKNYNYYLLTHPNNELGGLFMFTDLSVDDYATVFVNETEKLLMHLTTVVDTLSPVLIQDAPFGYPSVKLNDLVINSGGPYWRFLHQWEFDKDGILSKLIGEAEKAIDGIQKQGISINGESILQGARSKWSNALNM
jgi:hypothetical protein